MSFTSKWVVLGVLLTVVNLAFLLADHLEAAPSDIKGSPNVAVASYTTSEGGYILWSSGRITDAETAEVVAPPYEAADGFVQAAPEQKMPTGSPNVAVDYVQNDKGTFTLFADGSVKKASNDGASAPGAGDANVKFAAFVTDGEKVEHGFKLPATPGPAIPLRPEEDFAEGGILLIPVREAHAGPGFVYAVNIDSNGRLTEGGLPGHLTWTGKWIVGIGK